MEASSFWLIYIEDSRVVVSLLSWNNGHHTVSAIGPQKTWSADVEDSLDIAVDESLSAAATDAEISEDEEPVFSAFVLPPFWVGSDGKIVSHKLKLIEHLCKSLSLKPIGFISNDEAIVEEANQADGFPSSFVLLNINPNEFTLSLVYLGHVKERVRKNFEGDFDPKFVEAALLELKTDSTLPPQIVVFGQVSKDNLLDIKNYPWVGKKDIETFLHFPDVKLYQNDDLITIFAKTILTQINPQPLMNKTEDAKPKSVEDLEAVETEDEDISQVEEPKIQEEEIPSVETTDNEVNIVPELNLTEVSPEDLGFSETTQKLPVIKPEELVNFNVQNPLPDFTEPQISEPQIETISEPLLNKPKLSFGFIKKVRFPKIKIKRRKPFLFLLALTPLLILVPVLFSTAKITLFVTPYSFNKQFNITLDSASKSVDTSKSIIPVTKKTIDIDASSSVKTTGQKTVGDKAQGEVVVFNILTKNQTLPKGSQLVDPTGKLFELSNSVSVTAGTFDLNEGILKPGQTKASINAADIGPEFNINKDTKLQFKDFPESSLLAKVSENLAGGTKQTIAAVGDQDKKDLNQKVDQSINDLLQEKINKELSGASGIIQETIQSHKNKLDFSRELGEAADELSATANATVTVFILDDQIKSQIVQEFLGKEPGFADADIDPSNFKFQFKITKLDNDKATAQLTLTGNALPKINVTDLKKKLSGKSQNKASSLIKKDISRAYNYNIKTNLSFLKFINPLPFRPQNITIDIQTESL